MYTTIAEMRAEGVPELEYPDDRLTECIAKATRLIDLLTGQWFESREYKVRMKGRGGRYYPLPFYPISVTSVKVEDEEQIVDEDYYLYNDNPEDLRYPVVEFEHRIRRGKDIVIEGLFGFVEKIDIEAEDLSTPILIKKACIKLAIRELDLLFYEKTFYPGKLKSETTDGHSYTLMGSDEGGSGASLTGDSEVDEILRHYKRCGRIGSS